MYQGPAHCPEAAYAAVDKTRPGTGQDVVGQTVQGQITEITEINQAAEGRVHVHGFQLVSVCFG